MATHRLTTKNADLKGVADAINDHASAIDALITDFATLIAKLNLDAGVTDADYAQAQSAALDGDTID